MNMNRFIFLLFSFISVSASFAQLNGDGYYRVQNQYTSRYVVVLSNKADINYVTNEVDLGSIETLKPFNKIVSNPASVIYIEKHGSSGYVLKSQGTDTYSMIGYYLKIRDNKNGTYKAYASAGGMTKYLADEPSNFNDGILITTSAQTRDWYIKPISANCDNYFGLLPELNIDGSFYTTLFASFPFNFASAGMSAYYIYKIDQERGLAVYKELNEAVPASTPVIVKCSSDQSDNNKLNLLNANVTSLKDNLLGGVYFNNKNKKIYNRVAYNPSTMRVLGKLSDGTIGFVTANIDYLPANKAYLNVPAGTLPELRLISQDDYTTGIDEIVNNIDEKKDGIYTLMGEKINTASEFLPAGVYIINGKKVIVK